MERLKTHSEKIHNISRIPSMYFNDIYPLIQYVAKQYLLQKLVMPAVLYSWSLLISLRSSNSTVFSKRTEEKNWKNKISISECFHCWGFFSNPVLHKRLGNFTWGILFIGNLLLEILPKKKPTTAAFQLLSPDAASEKLPRKFKSKLAEFICPQN